MSNKFNYLISKQIVYNIMGGGGGPPAITFTINTLLANLTDEDKKSIEDSITEILQGLGSGNVTFGEFREGSASVDASPENFVSAEAVNEVINEPGNIKTLGTQRFIVAKIDELPVEYTDKLIIVPTDDNEAIRYINDGAVDTVEIVDWEAQGIAPEAIKSVAFGNSVQTIGNSAFAGCTSLTQVTIPNSVQTIELGAFGECESLTEVTIPNSVQTIGNEAFRLCTSLTEVTIPNSVQTIGAGAFQQITNLTQVTIPNSVTTIGNRCFRLCINLASVIFNSDITVIGTNVFFNCPAVTLPTTNFVVPNDRTEEISFGDNNGDFSSLGTGDGTLQFGAINTGGAGFKTVTVTPP